MGGDVAMDDDVEHVGELRDHWWWRPGWRNGRHFYACHVTFRDQPRVQGLVSAYQSVLRPMPGLDMIPAEWLHLTMQGIGFVDQIPHALTESFLEAAAARLAEVPAAEVTFHRPVVRPEAVYLPAEPKEPIEVVRAAVRAAVTDVFGGADLDDTEGYRPHVSVAYSNAAQRADPIAARLAAVRVAPVTMTLSTVQFLQFHRDRRMYEWTAGRPLMIGRIDHFRECDE